ncbi:MAG: hypothetical protein HXS53_07115 [Theionarchaea archaeon]|nr:hypothetical protein [Theionarchaea archaeon]
MYPKNPHENNYEGLNRNTMDRSRIQDPDWDRIVSAASMQGDESMGTVKNSQYLFNSALRIHLESIAL